jgi:hypothetical protein
VGEKVRLPSFGFEDMLSGVRQRITIGQQYGVGFRTRLPEPESIKKVK